MQAGVLGHPIAHSLSPVLHNAAYRELGLDWAYSAIDVEPDLLASVLTEHLIKRNDWAGFSITMPLKTHIVPWLTGSEMTAANRKAEISPLVTETGIANTIYRKADRLIADNTDVYGIITALREVIRHGPIEEIAILGSGATARSALAAAKELGAGKIAVYARPTKSQFALRQVAHKLGLAIIEKPLTSAAKELPDYDAVVSTMPKHVADPIASNLKMASGALLDVVYDPNPTDLAATWSALGGAIVGGERMLLHQAARQVELMTGFPAPLTAMADALYPAT